MQPVRRRASKGAGWHTAYVRHNGGWCGVATPGAAGADGADGAAEPELVTFQGSGIHSFEFAWRGTGAPDAATARAR